MQAANVSDRSIKVSAVDLMKPRPQARAIECRWGIRRTAASKEENYSTKHLIERDDIADMMCEFVLHGAIARSGTRVKAVIGISDQFARRHKLKFKLSETRRHAVILSKQYES